MLPWLTLEGEQKFSFSSSVVGFQPLNHNQRKWKNVSQQPGPVYFHVSWGDGNRLGGGKFRDAEIPSRSSPLAHPRLILQVDAAEGHTQLLAGGLVGDLPKASQRDEVKAGALPGGRNLQLSYAKQHSSNAPNDAFAISPDPEQEDAVHGEDIEETGS